MKLMTKAIERKARRNYTQMGGDLEQMVVAKFFDPCGSWTWYLMNQDPEDPNYLWGIVDGFAVEIGSFGLDDLMSHKGPMGIGIERDLYFTPIKARDVYKRLNKGEHI